MYLALVAADCNVAFPESTVERISELLNNEAVNVRKIPASELC